MSDSISVAALVLPVRDEMQRAYGRLACINAVAALVDAAAVLGLERLEPLTVRAQVFNPLITQQIGDLSAPDVLERIDRFVGQPGSVVVRVGMGDVPHGEWAGHLVAVTGSSADPKRIVLDATLEQANQPNDGIVLRPVVARVDSERLREGGMFRLRVNDCEIVYRSFPNDRFFESTPAWQDSQKRRCVRDHLVSQFR